MHFWNEKFKGMQEIKIKDRKIFLLFFKRLSIWEKYRVFYDKSANVFWIAQTSSYLYRMIMLIFSILISALYGSFILIMSVLSLDIIEQYFWKNLKSDLNDYKQEIKELLFPEKYGQFYSTWVTEYSGSKFLTLKGLLDDKTN